MRQFLALRGVAITLVVLHHSIVLGIEASQNAGFPLIAWWEYYPLIFLKNLGIFAVPTFLFVSGSFFAYAAKGQDKDVSYKVVWAGLKNILPPYILWSIVFYVMIYFLLDQSFTFWEYLKSLLVGYPYHFIPLIVFYYVVSPVIVRLSRYSAWVVLLAIGLYQFFSLSVVFPSTLGIDYPGWARLLTLPVLRETFATWGIYFPLGVVYTLNSQKMMPFLQKYWRWFAVLALALFVFAVLHEAAILAFPIAGFIAPVFFMFVIPVIQRQSIPAVRLFERIGKKAYGLYLTHLLFVNLVLAGFQFFAPVSISYLWITVPIAFVIALSLPLWVMNQFERWQRVNIYRYVFG